MFNTGESTVEKREQDDFILRLIRQIIRALADIAKLREGGRHEQALLELHDAYRSLLNVDPLALRHLAPGALRRLAAGYEEPLGLLLLEEARILRHVRNHVLAAHLERRAAALLSGA